MSFIFIVTGDEGFDTEGVTTSAEKALAYTESHNYTISVYGEDSMTVSIETFCKPYNYESCPIKKSELRDLEKGERIEQMKDHPDYVVIHGIHDTNTFDDFKTKYCN